MAGSGCGRGVVWQSRVCSRAGHPVAAPRERRCGCHSHTGSPSDVSTPRRGLCSPRHRVWSSPPGPACPTLTMAPSWATGFLWGLRWPRKECAAGLQLGTPFSSTPSPQVFQTPSVADWSADFLSLSLSEWPDLKLERSGPGSGILAPERERRPPSGTWRR